MRACVFPGQGSQFIGMGEGLFARHPELTAAADAILGYSVEELCLRDPDGRLQQTRYTQPALYVVNALAYLSRCADGAPPPDFVAGHSLGEYNALLAAGVFDFEAGLRLVQRRGELMSTARGGAMAAVMGCDGEKLEEILRSHGLSGIDVANHNAPSQVVLSGPAEEIERAEDPFVAAGATFVPLRNVSAAFHSRYMEALMGPLGEALDQVELRPPTLPVLSNVTARPHQEGEIREHLRRQLREPVRWTDSIRYLIEAGVEEFDEVGPGTVLTKLIRSIRRQTAAPPSSAAGLADALGAESFRRDCRVRRAYVAGSMWSGVSSRDLVVRMARAGYLGYFGAGGLDLGEVEENVRAIAGALRSGEPFGVGLPSRPDEPDAERALVELCLRHGIRFVEVASPVAVSPALVRYRLKGLSRGADGRIATSHKVMARVSRPEVAEMFLAPPPEAVVVELLRAGLISGEEAQLAGRVPMADDLCVEADAGGHADMALLLPLMVRRRDEARRRRGWEVDVRVGCGSGIGTPEAAASAFLLGADFVVGRSVHQCTVEAGTSSEVKDLLQTAGVHDFEPAPDGDLFELGAKVWVLKKDVLFPARANRLHALWRHHGSWEEIDAPARAKIERDCFGRGFERVWEELAAQGPPEEIARAQSDARHRMALVFRWYCGHALRLARAGAEGQRLNYQVRCGPALGAFNERVKGTKLESWRHRHVDVVADEILEGAARILRPFSSSAS